MKRAGGKPLSIHEMVARRKVAEAQKELREAEADIEEFELHAAEVLVDLLLALCAKVCTAHRSMQSKSQLQANSTPIAAADFDSCCSMAVSTFKCCSASFNAYIVCCWS